MPIEVIGVVSDYAATGSGEQQAGLTRDDMQAMIAKLTGMPLTLDHQHPVHSRPDRPITKHVTVGKIVKAWIDDIDCLRVKALIDDNVAHTVGADIRSNKLTGFSLGLDSGMRMNVASGDARHNKGLIECSITPNPEFKLTSFIAGVRNVDAATAAAAIEAAGTEAAAPMAVDHYELAPDAPTTATTMVSASNGERSAELQRTADEVLARVLEAQQGTRAKISKRDTLTSPSTGVAKASTQQRTTASMSRRQQQQQQQQQQNSNDDDGVGAMNQQQPAQQQQQVQYENRNEHDAAIRGGRTYQQPAPRSDVSPVVVNFNGMGAAGMVPQFEAPGGATGAHARRNAQRAAFNERQMAPLNASQQQAAYQQMMFQKFMQQQQTADQFDMMDGAAAGDDNIAAAAAGFDASMPPPQPHFVSRANKNAGGGESVSENTLNRKKEQEKSARAEMEFARSTGKFAPQSGSDAERFAEWLEFKNATKQKTPGKRTASAAAAITDDEQGNRQNPGIDLKGVSSGGVDDDNDVVTVDDNDDVDTIRMKLQLKKKLASAAADKKLYGMAGGGKKQQQQQQADDAAAAGGDDGLPMTPREKKLHRELELERSKSSAAAAVASIKGKMNATAPSDMAMATDDAGETARDIDELLAEHKELDTLLERDETGDIKQLKAVQQERDRLKMLKKELIELNKNINNLKGEDQDDEGVRALLETKLLAKQKKEKAYIDSSRKFVHEGTELVRKVNNANNKPTPPVIKNKLVALSNKDNFSVADLEEVAEKVEYVIQTVSASHESAVKTLADVKRYTMEAKNENAQMRFELKEKDDLLRRHNLGVASSSAVANRDPLSKAARSQNVLAAAASANDAAAAKKGVPSGGGVSSAAAGGGANNGKGAFADLITPEIAARLAEQAPIVGASDGYAGYNAKTMRRAVPLNELTPNDLFGVPWTCIPNAEAKNIKQRAEQCGFTATEKSPFSCFQQQKRAVPPEVKGRGMHVLTGAHMTGDPGVLGLGVKDEISPGSDSRISRDMFSNQRSNFNLPNGRAMKLDGPFVRLDSTRL